MTKLFAIPGLRLGYLVAHRDVVECLKRYKEPWTVNCIAQIAGERLLDEDDYVEESRKFVQGERQFLFAQLSQIDWLIPFPSGANFLLVRIDDDFMTAATLQERLIRKGMLIRDSSNFVGLDERFFRVAVKKRAENQKLISALSEITEFDGVLCRKLEVS